jgi:hypothetical protein
LLPVPYDLCTLFKRIIVVLFSLFSADRIQKSMLLHSKILCFWVNCPNFFDQYPVFICELQLSGC